MTVTKRFYLKAFAFIFVGSTLFHVGLALLRAWRAGWQGEVEIHVMNIAISTAVGLFLVHCLDAGYFRSAWAHIRTRSLKDTARSCIGFVLSHPMLFLALVLTWAMGLNAPALDTLGEQGRGVHSAAYTVGMGWLVMWVMWQSVSTFSGLGSIGALAVSMIERFLLLSLALLAIRLFSPELGGLIVAIRANPDASLAGLLGLLSVWLAFSLAPNRSFAFNRDAPPTAGAVGYRMRAVRSPRHPYDIKRTAVHEAGHLLLFAALPSLPNDLSVKVLREIGPLDEYRGQVSASSVEPEVYTEGFLRWSMLKHLAGSAAEASILGERADGANGDNQKWIIKATHFLTSGLGEAFYADAADEAKVAHNRAVLNALKAEQQDALNQFCAVNAVLLAELASVIEDKLSLTREEIQPFLERVVFTPEVARLAETRQEARPAQEEYSAGVICTSRRNHDERD